MSLEAPWSKVDGGVTIDSLTRQKSLCQRGGYITLMIIALYSGFPRLTSMDLHKLWEYELQWKQQAQNTNAIELFFA